MTRSADFSHTVKHGVRAAQPDIVIHAHHFGADERRAPQVGFVVAKSVGRAVDRHRVSRRLRHCTRAVIDELSLGDRLVVRALPSSRTVDSANLTIQLRSGIRRVREVMERNR